MSTPDPTADAADARASEFAVAFADAIASSGMSLDAIRTALAERGHQLSVATLSYWRSGRRRPERSTSLASLAELEGVLGVPAGALLAKLPGRGSPTAYDATPMADLSGPSRAAAHLTERLGLSADDGLERLSVQDLVELDDKGRLVAHRSRLLVRGLRPGADQLGVTFWVGADSTPQPAVRGLLGCTIGRTLVSPSDHLLVAEAVLDHPIDEDETALLEFEHRPDVRPDTSSRWERSLARTLPLYLASISFHPARMPTSVERYERPLRTDTVRSAPVLVTAPCVTVLFSDVAPGLVGLSWRW